MLLGIKNRVSKPELWLALVMGLTLSIGLAPMAYWVYFQMIGWPHPYITHTGPLWGTSYGYQLCWGNMALLCAFPLISLPLAANHRKAKHNTFSRLCLVLPLVQVILGLLNVVFLLGLLE
jgi:hypothetical protein